jgi:YD repeat-containing protein
MHKVALPLIFAGLLIIRPVHSQDTSEAKAIAIGPWQIEASFTEQRKFDRCVMRRTTADGIETRFTRDAGGLLLSMSSPKWQLGNGEKYSVEFAAGSRVWNTTVAATSDAVQVLLTDHSFNEALKRANKLEVRGAGSTIKVPLAKSAAALTRLESCYETNSKAMETNPFVAPKL